MFLCQFPVWKALLTSKKNCQQSNSQLVSNAGHCYLLAHLNIRFALTKEKKTTSQYECVESNAAFLLPVSAPVQDNPDVGEKFRQERVRLQQIRSDQESARSSPESRMHRKQEIDKIRKRPNQSVPGSKLVVYVFCLSLGTVIVIVLVVTKI